MTTKANLVELCSRQPGFDEIAWVMRARSTDETRPACNAINAFTFSFRLQQARYIPGSSMNPQLTRLKLLALMLYSLLFGQTSYTHPDIPGNCRRRLNR